MAIKVDPEFLLQLKQYKTKLHGKKVSKFGVQKAWKNNLKPFQYDWITRKLTDQDYIDHFYKDGIDRGNYIEGALGFLPVDDNGIVYRVVIDADNITVKKKCFDSVIPKYEDLNIDWIIEHGGDSNDRGHISFLVNAPKDLTMSFMRTLMAELKEPIFASDLSLFNRKDLLFDEIYGANKLTTLVREPYGFHAKRGKRYPMEYRGEIIDDPLQVIQTFIKMEVLSSDFMQIYVNERQGLLPEISNIKKPTWKPDKFNFEPLNLNLPDNKIPHRLKTMFSNCYAFNTLLEDSLEHGFIDARGNDHHEGGLCLADSLNYHDRKFDSKDGKQFYDYLINIARTRDEKTHHWWTDKDRYVWTCQTMNDKFGNCSNCPFKGQINSPADFIWGIPIKRKFIDNNLISRSLSEIRNKTMPLVKEEIKKAIYEHLNWDKSVGS